MNICKCARPKQKRGLFPVTGSKKGGSVGRDILLIFLVIDLWNGTNDSFCRVLCLFLTFYQLLVQECSFHDGKQINIFVYIYIFLVGSIHKLRSGIKDTVGRVTRNKPILFLGLTIAKQSSNYQCAKHLKKSRAATIGT